MDSYNSYTTTNSASSSSSYSADQFSSQIYQHQEEKRWKQPQPPPPPGHRSSLHSVRKSVITKKPISPMPAPNPPKVYKVDPIDFRDVVQRLTGGAAPEFLPTRLQEVAPPPLTLSPQENKPRNKRLTESNLEAISPLGFSLSPSSLEWCSSILLSPPTFN
ncbi:hypothetical protein ABFS83_08G059600 [Erythranthe nasuta]